MLCERLRRFAGRRRGRTIKLHIPLEKFAELEAEARACGTTVGRLVSRMVCGDAVSPEARDGGAGSPSPEEDGLVRELMDANAAYAVMKRRAFEAEELAKRLELAHGAITNENRMLREELANLRQELLSVQALGTARDAGAGVGAGGGAGGSPSPETAPGATDAVDSFMRHWGGGSARKARPSGCKVRPSRRNR